MPAALAEGRTVSIRPGPGGAGNATAVRIEEGIRITKVKAVRKANGSMNAHSLPFAVHHRRDDSRRLSFVL